MSNEIRSALREAVAETKSPGGVMLVGGAEETYFHGAVGLRQRVPEKKPALKDTLYDLASLTKVVATTTAVLMLRDQGAFGLGRSIADFVPFPAFRGMTLFHLLTHTSGLTPGNDYYRTASSLEEMLPRYAEEGILAPPGVEHRYSDVGFMLLGKLVEFVAGDSLDAFCRKRIFEPLGMKRTAFNPPADWAENCAATEDCPWRGRVMLGEVHDENAYALGGVSGHAGLFSTAEDLARFSRALLSGTVLKESTFREMTAMGQVPFYPWQGLGWQIDPWASKRTGFLPSRRAFGHTGWTGTSMWLDGERGLFVILLGNTSHPSRERMDNERFRRIVHRAVARRFYPGLANAHTGLDRVVRENFSAVKGRRIALLTHHAAVDQFGRPIEEVLNRSPDTELRILYSPEHGLRGQAEAGEGVGPQEGAVPVVSLYGDRRAPSAQELEDVDLFVVDLQDVGARYYTYMATMRRCMAACARAKTPVLVLDRPNPVGGEVLEGPIAVDTSRDICCAAIPIRHGMTMGELALFFRETDLKDSGLKLSVSPLDSWYPERLFGECSLPWIPPSPNIPTPWTALLYVGMCLFEGTNLNEGRGTETPFAVVGAPWLDAEWVAGAVRERERAGCLLEAVAYVPKAIPGKASDPRYLGRRCRGIRIAIQDPHAVRSFTLAVALLSAMRRRHPQTLEWTPQFDALAGGPGLRRQIESGWTASRVVRDCRAALRSFDASRPHLYGE